MKLQVSAKKVNIPKLLEQNKSQKATTTNLTKLILETILYIMCEQIKKLIVIYIDN